MVLQPALDLMSIGWPMATPRLNYFRDLCWRNPDACRFNGIVFERRITPHLHSIPIVELAELANAADRLKHVYVALTINQGLLERCKEVLRPLGIDPLTPSELARRLLGDRGRSSLSVSPFTSISLSDVRDLATLAIESAPRRIVGMRSLDTWNTTARAWKSYEWDAFYDQTNDNASAAPFDKFIDTYFRRGVNAFVVGPESQTDLIDLIVYHGALHRTDKYRVAAFGQAGEGLRPLLHQSVLGRRLSTNSVQGVRDALILSDSAEEFVGVAEQMANAFASSSAVVRLRRSLLDADRIARYLDERNLSHEIELEIASADPSNLIAHVTPRIRH